MKDNTVYGIQLLRFWVSNGGIDGELSTESGNEWSELIKVKERFKLKARNELQICAELENKHKFKLVCITQSQSSSGINHNEFILRRSFVFLS